MGNGNYVVYGGLTLPYNNKLQDIWMIKNIDKLKDSKTL